MIYLKLFIWILKLIKKDNSILPKIKDQPLINSKRIRMEFGRMLISYIKIQKLNNTLKKINNRDISNKSSLNNNFNSRIIKIHYRSKISKIPSNFSNTKIAISNLNRNNKEEAIRVNKFKIVIFSKIEIQTDQIIKTNKYKEILKRIEMKAHLEKEMMN